MKILLLKLKSNQFAFLFSILFTIFSFLFSLQHQWPYLGFALISIYFFWRKKVFWILAIVLFIFLWAIFIWQRPQDLANEQVIQNFKIIKITKNGFVVKYQGNKIFVTNFSNSFQVGDIVSINGTISDIDPSYQNYFYTQKIINTIDHAEITLIQEAKGLRSDMLKFINNSPAIYRNYFSLMFLGLKNVANENIYQMALEINVVHLFVISGFHISLLFFISQKILNFLKIKAQVSTCFALAFSLFYLYLIGFPLAASRAFLFLVLQAINKMFYQKKFSLLSIWGLTLLVFALVDPYELTNIGFVLTFGASLVLYFLQEVTFKSKLIKYLVFHFGIYIATLPIIVVLNQGLALWGLFFSCLLTPLFTIMYFLGLFLWPCKEMMSIVFQGFDLILKWCQQLSITIAINFLSWKITQTIYLWCYLSFIMIIQWNYFTVVKII